MSTTTGQTPGKEVLVAGAGAPVWPRITLVTAVYNGAHYLEATIRSIVNQGYPNLEYFIVDGGSTDGTVDIIRKYEAQITAWISEPDKGMYDALNKGFVRATGEVMGWLNASDILHAGGLFVVGGIFATLTEVEWITGRPTRFGTDGALIETMNLARWSRLRFLAGANRYIQQESTFWRKTLWERAGGRVDATLRAEGDFELWVRFFRHAKLYSVDALIGGYRLHPEALSSSDLERYHRTCDRIVEREVESLRSHKAMKLFRWMNRMARSIPKVRGLWYRLVTKSLYKMPGPDRAPVIGYDAERGWVCDRWKRGK
jgi:glycosyltransferase involved in cell wall biosynthesis